MIPKISEAEWEVMKILWGKSPMVFTEIKEKLSTSHDWKESTIHTLLSRLVEKGALKIIEVKPVKKYIPALAENECVIKETESFLDRVYNGAVNKLVSGFIENKKLSKNDIKELKDMLEKASLEE